MDSSLNPRLLPALPLREMIDALKRRLRGRKTTENLKKKNNNGLSPRVRRRFSDNLVNYSFFYGSFCGARLTVKFQPFDD